MSYLPTILTQTGVDLSARDTTISGILQGYIDAKSSLTNLTATGQTLFNVDTALSGRDTTISGILQTYIDAKATLTNLTTTGQTLFNVDTALSGRDATISGILQTYIDAKSSLTNLTATGQTLFNVDTALSGRDTTISGVLQGYIDLRATLTNVTATGQTLGARDATISGVLNDQITGNGTFVGTKTFSRPIYGVNFYSIPTSITTPSILGSITTATGNLNVDFSGAGLQSTTLTGLTLISGLNYSAGASVSLRVFTATNTSTFAFPSTWRFVGTQPTGLSNGKVGVLTMQSYTNSDTGVIAAWAYQS